MADMLTPETVRNLKKEHPKAAVVCYVNSSAETKAECDICCTSANAVNISKNIGANEIIFIPDKNLGAYVSQFVPGKKFIFMDGYCPIHKNITLEETLARKQKFPGAKFAAHPECEMSVLKLADFVGSTSMILDYCINSGDKEFIIGTEQGVIDRLRFYHPEKTYHILSPELVCPDMRNTTLGHVYDCLANEPRECVTELAEDIINKANIPLEKMLVMG
jgi:quinolinate synthase